MGRGLLAMWAVTAIVVSTSLAGDDKKEIEKFRGTWRIVAVEQGGEKAPEEVVKQLDIELIFEGDKYTEKVSGKVSEDGTFKVDTSKTPHHLDLTIESGKDKGKKQMAVYKFDGDRLIVALSGPGSAVRPAALTTKEGSEYAVHTLARKKDAK